MLTETEWTAACTIIEGEAERLAYREEGYARGEFGRDWMDYLPAGAQQIELADLGWIQAQLPNGMARRASEDDLQELQWQARFTYDRAVASMVLDTRY